jgi:methionyl-tRNA formyltransferase
MPTSNLKIVFMGTPEFAVGSLRALINEGFNIVAVVTTPDKPAGRGQKIQESDVKQYAKSQNLPILQPEKLKDPEFIGQLKEINADLNVVVAFRMLPEIVWSMPRLGTINLHGSLLPHYRGAAPINWAVINGESETGVTTFFIEKEIDTGKIIYSSKIPIGPNDNAGAVHDRLMETGATLLVKTVADIEKGTYPQTDQLSFLKPEEPVKIAPKIFKDDCKIKWDLPLAQIHNLIRGLSPYPAAWSVITHKNTGERLNFKLFATEREDIKSAQPVKTILTDEKSYLKIAVKDGYLKINSIQVEGKKRLPIDEFLRGFKINEYMIGE